MVTHFTMPLTIYCRFNSFCVNKSCSNKHHHSFFENKLLHDIINLSPEISMFKEVKTTKPICKHGLRCYEVECDLQHGLNPDGRRLLRKKFDKELKVIQTREKIRSEIETYKRGASYDWNELDPRP